MKKIRLIVALAFLIICGLIAIDRVQIKAAKAKINKSEITLEAESRVKLKIKNTKKKVKWSSSDKTIAKVSQKGNVTGVTPGTCIVTAKVGTKSFTCKVTVKDSILEQLNATQTIRGVVLRKSSSWDNADDKQSVNNYHYSMSEDTFIWNWAHIVELHENERIKIESSEENYKVLSENLINDILKDYDIKDYTSEITKYEKSFLGKTAINCVDNGNDIGIVIYTRIIGNKLVLVMGMEIDELEPEIDKIIRKICTSAKLK